MKICYYFIFWLKSIIFAVRSEIIFMRKLQRNIFMPVLMLVLFMSYQVGITLFVHTHMLMNGVVVAHSHPYADKSHKHAEAQIVAFNVVSALQSLEPDSYDGDKVYLQVLREIGECNDISLNILLFVSFFNIRAPSYC